MISKIETKLNGKDLIWNLNPDVNILVGFTATGKTRLLEYIEDLYDVIIFYPSIEGIDLYNKFVDKFNGLHNGNTLNYIDEQTIFNDNLSSGQLRLLSIFGKFNKNTKLFVYDDIDCYLNHSIQQILLEFLTEINPACQIVISTNSGSIFIEGWADKVQFIEKLFINHD
jgi:recombinational DNA repair ATPase RecF